MPDMKLRDEALATLMALRPDALAELPKGPARTALDEQLIRSVFTQAWSHQYDDDLAEVSHALRELVREAVDRVLAAERL